MKDKFKLDDYLNKRKKGKNLYPPAIDYIGLYVVFLGLPFLSGYNYGVGNNGWFLICLFFALVLFTTLLFGKKILAMIVERI